MTLALVATLDNGYQNSVPEDCNVVWEYDNSVS